MHDPDAAPASDATPAPVFTLWMTGGVIHIAGAGFGWARTTPFAKASGPKPPLSAVSVHFGGWGVRTVWGSGGVFAEGGDKTVEGRLVHPLDPAVARALEIAHDEPERTGSLAHRSMV